MKMIAVVQFKNAILMPAQVKGKLQSTVGGN
jgi:hypothetical protein